MMANLILRVWHIFRITDLVTIVSFAESERGG